MLLKRFSPTGFLWLLLIFTISCKNTHVAPSVKAMRSSMEVLPVTAEPLKVPSDSSHVVFDSLGRKKAVLKFYHAREGRLLWIDRNKLSPLGDSMTQFIQRAKYYGLNPDAYHLNELSKSMGRTAEGLLMRKEVLLTDAFFMLSHDLKGKMRSAGEADDSVAIELLNQVVEGFGLATTLESREPDLTGYKILKDALKLALDSIRYQESCDSVQLHQIQLAETNMARWRMEDAPWRSRYIFINIPSFMLYVVDEGKVVFTSKVIVGTPEKQTPLLSSVVECFTIYPYWHVPRKIAVEEYLPVIQRDTSFIKRNNFDVLDRKGKILNTDTIPWAKFHKNYFPVSLRQREGEENALGVIKFMFDNPYAVYLHDTNAKRLFRNDVRAYSHGCIRMEKAVELAHYLATGELGENSTEVERYLRQEERHTVNLNQPITIYVRYFTAEAREGEFYEYPDIYEKGNVIVPVGYNGSK